MRSAGTPGIAARFFGTLGGAGLVIGFFGVLVLISNSGAVSGWSAPKSALLGVLSGAGFAVAAVCYRAAALSLDAGSAFERAGITLAAVTTLQTLAMAFWLQWREPGEVARRSHTRVTDENPLPRCEYSGRFQAEILEAGLFANRSHLERDTAWNACRLFPVNFRYPQDRVAQIE